MSVCVQDSDRSSSDGAFQAWLRAKAKQRRTEQRRNKSDTDDADQVKKQTPSFIVYLFIWLHSV